MKIRIAEVGDDAHEVTFEGSYEEGGGKVTIRLENHNVEALGHALLMNPCNNDETNKRIEMDVEGHIESNGEPSRDMYIDKNGNITPDMPDTPAVVDAVPTA